MVVFDEEEYRTRLDGVHRSIVEKDLDGLLVTDPANILYLTGYDAWSFYVPQAVLVTRERSNPMWIGREMDANAARQTTWLDDEDIRPYEEDYIKTVRDHHPMDAIATELEAHGIHNGVLGVEMGGYYFTGRDYKRISDNLPQADLVDTTNLVNWHRLIKSPREIELIRNAASITDAMVETAIDAIEPGVPQNEVVAELYSQMVQGTDEFGGDYAANPPMMPVGKGTNTPHLTWTDEELESGQPVILEISGCRNRYHSPLARTVHLGPPSDALQALHDVTVAGLELALDTIQAGMPAEEIAHTYQEFISEHGYEKDSRLGYRAGSGEYPPSWGEGNWERVPSLQSGDTTILEPNMTFHVIAGMWEESHGIEVSETIRVTKDGCEVFGRIPRKLFVV